MDQFLWFSTIKKCAQAAFYFLTNAEKHILLTHIICFHSLNEQL